jgi:hypothetical protein
VFESRTGQTEDEKLNWSFSGLNCERMSVGYVAELHCGLCYRAALWVMLQSCIVGYVAELHCGLCCRAKFSR